MLTTKLYYKATDVEATLDDPLDIPLEITNTGVLYYDDRENGRTEIDEVRSWAGESEGQKRLRLVIVPDGSPAVVSTASVTADPDDEEYGGGATWTSGGGVLELFITFPWPSERSDSRTHVWQFAPPGNHPSLAMKVKVERLAVGTKSIDESTRATARETSKAGSTKAPAEGPEAE